MMVSLASVVEGNGEVQSVPVLVRRVAEQVAPELFVKIPRPVLLKRTRVGDEFPDLQRAIEQALKPIKPPAAVFILLDADDEKDCPARLGPALLQRAQAIRGDLPIAVVLAKREYESWFLAAAESLRGKRGLPLDLEAPANMEDIRGAKEWLQDRTPTTAKYSPTTDQAGLTAAFDMETARQRSDSFGKCWRELARLLTLLRQAAGG